ncbi:hypothetical protein F53441_13779 [Fusarium austroafricanum]|uniref:Uncharacterized protein n=1 Tax=Fusarium austroafricanum TaxID=2364996 RepID=A0A8H4NPI8_9HYPO|nr:hypothetical protein F53441_13779 [Fusarium austroafricanum]
MDGADNGVAIPIIIIPVIRLLSLRVSNSDWFLFKPIPKLLALPVNNIIRPSNHYVGSAWSFGTEWCRDRWQIDCLNIEQVLRLNDGRLSHSGLFLTGKINALPGAVLGNFGDEQTSAIKKVILEVLLYFYQLLDRRQGSADFG